MFAKCSNPDCGAPFDYREGRLVRFCKPPLDERLEVDRHRIEHFWLCGSCSHLYVFEYQREMGMKVKFRERELQGTADRYFVTAA
jgi:hypothetical protein